MYPYMVPTLISASTLTVYAQLNNACEARTRPNPEKTVQNQVRAFKFKPFCPLAATGDEKLGDPPTYRLRASSSSNIPSVTVTIRELAWNPRCVVIIRTNSEDISTLDCSSE